MSTPTLAQLRNLADRAEHHGGLTGAEAARLREGINLLDRPRTAPWTPWSNKVRGLRRKLHQLHAPMLRDDVQVYSRCTGEWPCPTIDAFDRTFPVTTTDEPAEG